jgi:signal peptide peptidase SppA
MRIAARLFNRPLMISEGKLDTILHVFSQRAGLDLVGLPRSEALEISDRERARAGYAVKSGIAILGVYGPLMHRVLDMEFPSGGPTTYADLRQAFDTALADDGVQGIVFDFDTPGGEVNGAFDLADHIYQSRAIKPITACVNEEAYSAGYLLASACGRIVLPRTGGVGSVGVIATHTEFSRWEEENGIAVTHIFAGARKADFSPHLPLSSEAAQILQGMVDDSYSLFVETVARNRGMKVQAVIDTQAGIYEGKKAVKAGLADEVSAVDKAIQNARKGKGTRLIAASAPAGSKQKEIKTMTIEQLREEHPDLLTQIENQARQGMIAQAEADTAKATAVTAENTRVMGIVAALVGDQVGKQLTTIVSANLTAEQVADLGLSVAATAGGSIQQQMLTAITSAAPAGIRPAQGKAAEKQGINTAGIYAGRRAVINGK